MKKQESKVIHEHEEDMFLWLLMGDVKAETESEITLTQKRKAQNRQKQEFPE